MPWVDDVLNGLKVQIDQLWYDLLHLLAVAGWSLQKGLFMMGHTIDLINLWLVDNAFAPLIQQTNNQMRVTASLSFVIALFVLGVTYLLAAFVRLNVVNPRSAIGWYLAGAVFFQLGPTLYQGMYEFRRDISSGFYHVALESMEGADSPFGSLAAVNSNDLPPLESCDALGPYLPGAQMTALGEGVDGLDVALAYLRADGEDVMGYPSPIPTACFQPRGALYERDLPANWQFYEDSYFYTGNGSWRFEDMTDDERKASIDKAGAAQFRIFSAWPLVIFGVIEQLIYLMLTIAQGLTFVSFAVAIVFAFFKKTEGIARSVLDMWIELIIQTIVIALLQSLLVSFLLGAAATHNALVVLGVSLIGTVLIWILLMSGIKAVWNSINRLFGAIGQATGGIMVSPGAVAVGAVAAGAAVATGGASLAMSVGSSALAGASALGQGATTSQAAGVMLGGSRSLSAAARTLAYLPGLRGTDLSESAGEFTEGAMVRQVGESIPLVGKAVGPLIGAHLLSDRSEKHKRDDNTLTLPAEPVEGDLETTEGLFTPVRPRRMGTFTPLEAALSPAYSGEEATQTRTAVSRVQSAAEMQGEEVEEQVSAVGANVRSQAGQAKADRERSDYADDMHGEEVEDRITLLGATMHPGQTAGGDASSLDRAAGRLSSAAEALGRATGTQPMLGLMRIEGANNVAGVMGDFISQMRVQRTLDGQPLAGGADHFTVAQGVARAMGVTPETSDRAPMQGDVARLGLFGDQALKLGLTGQQVQTVISEVKASPTGELTPPTRTALVEQARGTLNTGWDGAQSAVDALQRAAAMLPNAITARGAVSVPNVTVTPQVQVNVSAPEQSAIDQALLSQAALAGSQNTTTQRGEV